MSPRDLDQKRYELAQDLLGRFDQAIQAAHWRVRGRPTLLPKEGERDLGIADREIIDPRHRHWTVVLKTEPGRARGPALCDRLAAALLEAASFARRRREQGPRSDRDWQALALVGAPKLSERIVDRLKGYARVHAPPGIAWGALDLRGIRLLEGVGLQEVERVAAQLSVAPAPMESASPSSPFTDLGQWLLKVLLEPRLPAEWAPPPIEIALEEPNRIARLALRSNVSIATVSKFSKALTSSGFSRPGAKGIELIRVRELLEEWFRVVASQPVVERRAKFLFGDDPDVHGRIVSILKRHAGKPDGAGRTVDACLCGFSAARELGMDFVTGAPVQIYSRDVSDDLLRRFGLRPVDDGSPFDLVVRRPPFPEAVFRAVLDAPSGVRVTDAIQCWLDVRAHPARGAELAEELWRRTGLERSP